MFKNEYDSLQQLFVLFMGVDNKKYVTIFFRGRDMHTKKFSDKRIWD